MKIEFLKQFSKDIDKISSPVVKKSILNLIEEPEAADSIRNIRNLKKIVGFKTAYRIKLGQYRIGFFIEKNGVQLARVAHWTYIYRLFH